MGKGHAMVSAALLCLSACAHATGSSEAGATPGPEPTSKPAPDAPASEPTDDVTHHMQANFDLAGRARDALIAGRLEEARTHARALREQGAWSGFPDEWKFYLEQMRQHADELVLAADLQEAALALGQLGVSCGDCHWFSRKGPDTPRLPPMAWEDPPEPLDARMLRHDVGMAQMWVGLVQPSEQAFRAGTITITRAPLPAPQTAGEPVDEHQHAAFERIRALAKEARTASTHGGRAQVYGQLLSQCAACHQVTPR